MMCMVLRRAPCLAGLGAERDMRKLEAHFFAFILICHSLALSLHAKIGKMAETLLFSMLIIAISVALLCVKVILRKNGRFSSQHVKDNPGLRKRKIHCVMEQDREARQPRNRRNQ